MLTRRYGQNGGRSAFALISSILWAIVALTTVVLIMTVANHIAESRNWQTSRLRSENTAVQALAVVEMWLRSEAGTGDLFSSADFAVDFPPLSNPLIIVPDELLSELRGESPYAVVSAEVIDLNYAKSWSDEGLVRGAPRVAPRILSVDGSAYSAKYVQILISVALADRPDYLFRLSATYLALRLHDGNCRISRLYSKKS